MFNFKNIKYNFFSKISNNKKFPKTLTKYVNYILFIIINYQLSVIS